MKEILYKITNRTSIRLRIVILKMVCTWLLPRGLWVGKHFGAYTQRSDILFGRIDNRGVIQGVSDRDICA